MVWHYLVKFKWRGDDTSTSSYAISYITMAVVTALSFRCKYHANMTSMNKIKQVHKWNTSWNNYRLRRRRVSVKLTPKEYQRGRAHGNLMVMLMARICKEEEEGVHGGANWWVRCKSKNKRGQPWWWWWWNDTTLFLLATTSITSPTWLGLSPPYPSARH